MHIKQAISQYNVCILFILIICAHFFFARLHDDTYCYVYWWSIAI